MHGTALPTDSLTGMRLHARKPGLAVTATDARPTPRGPASWH